MDYFEYVDDADEGSEDVYCSYRLDIPHLDIGIGEVFNCLSFFKINSGPGNNDISPIFLKSCYFTLLRVF